MKTSYSPSIYFSQNDIISFLKHDKSTPFMDKIKSVSLSKESYIGLCYGLSMKFLHHPKSSYSFKNDIECYIDKAYCKEDKKTILPKIITEEELISHSDNARKKVISNSGKKILTEAIEIQTLHHKSIISSQLNRVIIPPSEIVPKASFLKKILEINDNNKKHYCEIVKKNNSNDDYILFKRVIKETQPQKNETTKKLYNELVNSEVNKKNEYIDNAVEYLKKEIDLKKDTFNYVDIQHFLQAQAYIEYMSTQPRSLEINTKNNIKITKGEHNNKSEIYIKTLPNLLLELKETVGNNKNYLISSNGHAMALRTNLHDKQMEYIFFDPNEGIYTFKNIEELEIFLRNFIKEHPEYSFQKQDENYCFNIAEFEKIEQRTELTNDEHYEQYKINLIKILIKNKISLKLKNGQDSLITPISFNEKNDFLELEFNDNDISRKLYSAESSIEELHILLKHKITLLKENDGPYFIDKKRNIYQISDEKLMNELTTNSDLTQLFGSPIFKSPTR